MLPLVVRTWAPRGAGAVLRHRTASHQKVSVIGAVTISPRRRRLRLVFRVHRAINITAPLVQAFLRQLLRQVAGPVVLVWDRLRAHQARRVTAFTRAHLRLHLESFPPYAPELNPMEYAWSWAKKNPLANRPVVTVQALAQISHRAGRRLQHRESLLRSFVRHTHLPLRLM